MDKSREQSAASSSEKDGAAIKLRQGSILPKTVHDRLDMSSHRGNPDLVAIVISHDCDLVKPHRQEPQIELIYGRSKDELKGGLSNGQSPHTLQLEFEENGKKRILELCALDKVAVDKGILFGVEADPDVALTQNGVKVLRLWLAARYNRAAFPDELNRRIDPIKKKLRSVDPRAVSGIWMQYEPEDDELPEETPYELTVKVVYSTLVYDARVKAEQEATKLRSSFEKRFLKDGLWHFIDLRGCDAVADTVFSLRDFYDYKQWRLEDLSMKQDPPGEYI